VPSSAKLFFQRLVPRRLWRTWVHARAKLALSNWAGDQAYREQFFDLAFKALAFNGIDGDYAEFGCGRTLTYAYDRARRHGHPAGLWGFDSFQGLPAPEGAADEHPEWKEHRLTTPIDDFRKFCRANGVPDGAYTLVEGFFADTLGKMAPTDAPTDICLAYVDCDMYSSTKTVLEFLAPRLKHGMVLAFDDYHCWSSTQVSGNRRAAVEFFEGHARWGLVPFLQYGWHGTSYAVEDKRLWSA
jgi:hypothetical protein